MAKKIVLEFDIDSKDVKIAGQDALSLTQQLRILKKELQKGDLGQKEFEILRKKIGDTEDQIAKTTVKSRGFFDVLSTLPGPVGQFSSSISNAIDTLKVFSSFSFKDIKNSLSDIVDDVKDVVNNFLGLNNANKNISDSSKESTNALNQQANASAAAAAALKNQTKEIQLATVAIDQRGQATIKATKPIKDMTAEEVKLFSEQKKLIQTNRDYRDAITKQAVANDTASKATLFQKVQTQALTLAQKAATFATNALKVALASLGIGLVIIAVTKLVELIGNYISQADDATKENERLTVSFEVLKRAIDDTQTAIKDETDLLVLRAKIIGKSEEDIFKIVKEGLDKRVKATQDAREKIESELLKLSINTELKEEDRLKFQEDLQKQFIEQGNKLNDLRIEGEKLVLNEELRIAEKSRANQKENNDKKAQQNKQYLDQVIADTKTANDLLRQLQQENAVLRLKDERDRQDQELKNAYENEKRVINNLKISNELRAKLQKELDTKFALKITEVANKRNEEDLKRSNDFLEKKYDILTNAIENEVTRQKVERENQYRRDLAALEEDKSFIAASEEEKNKLRKAIKVAYDRDIETINKDAREKERQDALKALDDQLKILELRGQVLQQGTQEYFRNQEELLAKAYEKERLLAEGNARLLLEIEKKYQKDKKNLKDQEIAAYGEIASATIASFAAITGALAAGYDEEAKSSKAAFEQRKKLQKATALMSAASGIIQILTQPSTLPSPFDWIVKVANAAALAITTGVQIGNINKTKFEGEGGTTGQGSALPRQYADGGLIGGRRHAEGGTMIEAERGEAVMTRGAVTMFAPLLSMMNQMGGGVSFSSNLSTARPDMPTVSNPSQNEPVIMKTYVVENELTTVQQRQARLKDLSTL